MTKVLKFLLIAVMAMSMGLAAAADIVRYAYITALVKQSNGTVINQQWKYTYINNKLRAKDMVSSTVVGGSPIVVLPMPPTVPKPVFDARFNAASYYNNSNMGTPTAVPSFDPSWYLTSEAGKTISATGANYAYARG